MTEKFSPKELVEKTLGKGIHPNAIERLMEMCPQAVVRVYHTRPIEKVAVKQIVTLRGTKTYLVRLRETSMMPSDEERVKEFSFSTHGGSTEVTIAESPDLPPVAKAIAACSAEDPFCRSSGRALAFNRALKRFGEVTVHQEEDARGMASAD